MNEVKPSKLSLEQEREIIQQTCKDPSYFRPVYEAYFEDVFRFSFHRLADKEEAAEVTSRTFFNALTKIKTFEDRGISIKPWLIRIAFNEIQMLYRVQKRTQTVQLDTESLELMVEEVDIEVLDHTAELTEALDQMSDEELEMIEMKYFEHRSHKEIAEILDISVPNAKVKLHRALKKLKKFMMTPLRNEK